MGVYDGRYYPTDEDIEPIEWIVERLMKNKDFDILSAYYLAVEIQRNQMIRSALYLFNDGDGPVLYQIADEFTRIRKGLKELSDQAGSISYALDKM